MFCKSIANYFLFLLLIIIPLSISGQDSTVSKEAADETVEIVLNKIHDGGESGIQSRHIFILIEEKDFNLSNLQKIFEKYKTTYKEPYILVISVYTSREMLQRLINFEKQPMTIEFSEDEKGQEAARKFYERNYPLSKGYLRAEYNRYGKFEFFDYSPQKEEPQMVRISLKKRFNER